MSFNRIAKHQLNVAEQLLTFVENDLLSGLDIISDHFWNGFSQLVEDLTPKNRALLEKRDLLQQQIDSWHNNNNYEATSYKTFLKEIGYLLPEGEDFQISTDNIDSEIAEQAGPQLVVPVKNARFALNACNARWGSLYDALYGTDAISDEGGAEQGSGYNPIRGNKVITYGRNLLDKVLPLNNASHHQVTAYKIINGLLSVTLDDGTNSTIADSSKLVGFRGDAQSPASILIVNNHLHLDIIIDTDHPIGKTDKAGVCDIMMEAAVTTIMDCEDSVAAVDCEDKVEVYSNWLGLMKGTLEESFEKNGSMMTRSMNADINYNTASGDTLTMHGRSLLLVRNVGHLMTNNAILDSSGAEVFEGIMDAMITTAAALHDLKKRGNSKTGSIYIVKPKMHGPEEVALSCELFSRVEAILSIAPNTLKIGIMDEERRTTVNLKECIRVAKERVVFINTGFLDRTGDEIHTSMQAGAMVAKTKMKQQTWINAYEAWNVDIGIRCGLPGRAQIGKGMWAMPDEMAAMLEQKIGHPASGANTAWVPSPNGAVLHSIHYHQVSVEERQQAIAQKLQQGECASLDDILQIPLLQGCLSDEEIQFELDNNAQGILGYVVRWIDNGVGCSKVPDINAVGLMEDRATLRISSQHLANWLLHGICTRQQVTESLRRMAVIVDTQNASDPGYIPMAPDYEGTAFQAACDLVFKGIDQPSGYTEPLLHAYRLKKKLLT